MRYVSLLLITFIFAACGNQKMRFVRTNSTKQKVVEIQDVSSIKVKKENIFTPENTEANANIEKPKSSNSTKETDEFNDAKTTDILEEISPSFPNVVQDSTTVSQEEAESIKNEALRGERLGNASFLLSILFIVLVLAIIILSFVAFANSYSPVAVIFSIIFSIVSAVSLIVSVILGAASLKAAYNTKGGRLRAIVGISISSFFILLILGFLAFNIL